MNTCKKSKLITVDLDGTLLNGEKSISELNRKALIAAQEKGHKVAIASGRPIMGCRDIADALLLDRFGGYVICFNGSEIVEWNSKKHIYDQLLPDGIVEQIWQYAEENNLTMLIHDDIIITSNKEHPRIQLSARRNGMEVIQPDDWRKELKNRKLHKCMFIGEPEEMPRLAEEMTLKFPEVNVIRSEPHFLEFVPKDIDKGTGLKTLAKHINCNLKDVIAFGDALNDICMLNIAGTGVAMGNAEDSVKAAADIIAPPNTEDGVAKIINDLLL